MPAASLRTRTRCGSRSDNGSSREADLRALHPGDRLDASDVPAFEIGSPRVMDSTGALELADLPETLLVIGGGYIGLEMGTVYAELGTKVSVVELTDGLLPGADRDLVKPLHNGSRSCLQNPH